MRRCQQTWLHRHASAVEPRYGSFRHVPAWTNTQRVHADPRATCHTTAEVSADAHSCAMAQMAAVAALAATAMLLVGSAMLGAKSFAPSPSAVTEASKRLQMSTSGVKMPPGAARLPQNFSQLSGKDRQDFAHEFCGKCSAEAPSTTTLCVRPGGGDVSH